MLTLSCDEVADGLIVGTYPQTPEDVRQLRQVHGVTALLCLQDDRDFEYLGVRWDLIGRAYTAQGILAVREPVRDFSPRELVQRLPRCVAALHDLAAGGRRVYLHCTAGLNRSPTVAIAYLYVHCGMSPEEAAQQVMSRRDCQPYDDVLARLPAVFSR